MDKERLLDYLVKCRESKSRQIDRLVEEGSDDSECICEWGIYAKLVQKIEKGEFDKEVTPCKNVTPATTE